MSVRPTSPSDFIYSLGTVILASPSSSEKDESEKQEEPAVLQIEDSAKTPPPREVISAKPPLRAPRQPEPTYSTEHLSPKFPVPPLLDLRKAILP